jgi:hypothetical protein
MVPPHLKEGGGTPGSLTEAAHVLVLLQHTRLSTTAAYEPACGLLLLLLHLAIAGR